MNPGAHAARLGLARGWIEFKHSLANPQDIGWTIFTTLSFIIVLFFQRDAKVPGTDLSLAAATLPSLMGLMVAFSGFMGTVGALVIEREDGTLLRAKALPQGMLGYLIGRVVSISLSGLGGLVLLLLAGVIMIPEIRGAGPGGWLMVVLVALLSLTATLPMGAVIGSLANSPQAASGLSMLTMGGLTAISGIFYPISALAGWLQGLAHVFPLYWLGLGMRSALMPDAAAAVEIGGSWRTLETFGVLGAWSVLGLLLAPPILRRMARRESGSLVQERRERALRRIG
ncbi:ABC transporter permease [Nonomuraea sp. NN258]|uniref:ABC transporter permease n=1 Tax=Nonomuraea antri TaxID=2730852 RepID=UPI0015686F97|nr:ABC transporter permease [Nonomuraea antri]NRQ34342.1 ABC transporter permease [Nonomuraea antri]